MTNYLVWATIVALLILASVYASGETQYCRKNNSKVKKNND